jgi:hypothetical protein
MSPVLPARDEHWCHAPHVATFGSGLARHLRRHPGRHADPSRHAEAWPDLVADPLLSEWSRAGYQPEIRDVFDPDGRFVGTDWVIVTERDELDVQYIVKYTIAF